jgi:putative phosphoribosyl transferase
VPIDLQISERSVEIPPAGLIGDLTVPANAYGVVVFAHGSGSSRLSPRNKLVACSLQQRNLATLLLDLLTPDEEQIDLRTGHLRFDVNLLANRLAQATKWITDNSKIGHLPMGYFGASTGAAAALIASSQLAGSVRGIVSRGGRPDLAGTSLPKVKAPTLLIAGGADYAIIDLNEKALKELQCEKRLEIVPGATHLFEEPGTLERVAELASDWFEKHLSPERRNKGNVG